MTKESSGSPLELGRAALVDAAIQADIALAFEPGDGNPETAVLARRGFTGWELEVQGMRAHSSAVFSEKVGYGFHLRSGENLNGLSGDLGGGRSS